ncbi:hypothetical protein ACFQT0_16760 [Hymenobacter humi]|uniref:Uncharacterized protein n=1 Tax=Hymenobacter humi TaxID=1411620 RepID=A0ABW2U7M6_9BACT
MKRGTTKSLLHKRALGWAGLVGAVLALAPAAHAQSVPASPPAAALGQPAQAPTGPGPCSGPSTTPCRTT